MTNLATRIRPEHPLPKGRRRAAILLALAMIAGACLAPVAASAGDSGDGGAAVGGNGGKDADSAAAGVAPPAAERAAEAAAGEAGVVDETEPAAANAGLPVPTPPSRPHADARRARAPAASPLPAPLRWLMRNASRSLAHAAGAVNHAGGAALGRPLAWLGARLHASASDQDRAREAVKKGQIVPLASILKTVRESVPGDVLKVALNRDVEGSWKYSITVLTPQGYYRDVNVDAGSNQITQIKGH
ncbi:MAG: hypothetical protein ABSA66_19035 [Roseiarcus sp.]|jgi:hypothetical protein